MWAVKVEVKVSSTPVSMEFNAKKLSRCRM